MLIATLVAFAGETPALPVEWHGTWRGPLVNTSAAGKATEVPMSLAIEPIKGTREVTWVITYGEGEKAIVRDYKLVPDGDKPGRFKIDEKNGIVLGARLVNGVIYCQFEVAGNLLTARYELRDKGLRFEITSAKPEAEKTGAGKVQDYAVGAVQVAELKRK